MVHLVSGRNEILLALFKNREGMGHNDLRRAGISGKTLQKWLSKSYPQLVHDGLVRIEEGKSKGGKKKLHFLTQRGIEFVERHIVGSQFLKEFFRVYDGATEKERLEALGKLFGDLFKLAYNRLMVESKPEFLRALNDVQVWAIMDLLNEPWLSKKDDFLKHKEKESMMKVLDVDEQRVIWDTEEITGTYMFQDFRRFSYPLEFIVADVKAAWGKGHYLNTHHRYVLEKLGLHSKEEIEKKNEDWFVKHSGVVKDSIQHRNTVLVEIKERLNDFYTQIESLMPKRKNGKILYDVVVEDGIKKVEFHIEEPPEKYYVLPNWMLRLVKGEFNNYGGAFWDIR